MRIDSLGLFWEDTDYKTEKKETLLEEEGWVQVFSGFWAEQWRIDKKEDPRKICIGTDKAYAIAKANRTGEKRTPPDPVWLDPMYLPGLEEARQFNIPILTDYELVDLSLEKMLLGKPHKLVFDIECYGNYFLIAFLSVKLGKVTYLELSDDTKLDCRKLAWIFNNFCVIGFNSRNYDMIIAAMAVDGCSTPMMKSATTAIIEFQERGYEVLRRYKVKQLDCDHIDLIEVAPLFASLKIYGGRMHSQKMQDLPFHPDTVLSEPQRAIVRWYCVNDLTTTLELYQSISTEVDLRALMGRPYGLDLRSKSDAQIAEAVIGHEIEQLNNCRAHKPNIEPGTMYGYKVPQFINFKTQMMNTVVQTIWETPFVVSENGAIGLPDPIKKLEITINKTTYKMGIGGLHSTESKACHFSGPNVILKDVDVISYYPKIILILGLYPEHLGPNFLIVYKGLVDDRIDAKRAGDKRKANSLKIVVNGSFGKLGSSYSILYAPDLLIQVTITGQLSLLMLIERLELAGINVVSANTDGVVIKCEKSKESIMTSILNQWQLDTGFELEETLYKALYSRDVNNYLAIKEPSTWKEDYTTDDKVKTKGIFATPGLSKNPQNEICIIAITELLLNNIPIWKTITECKDITKFVNVRTVKGGAVKLAGEGEPGLYLGKAIRWYYASDERGEIVYARSGNKVPKSDGAKPLMELPNVFPTDVDYTWYERETLKILKGIGYEL